MSLSPRKIGSVVLMLVLVHLFTPAVHALPLSGQQGAFRSGDAFAAVREWLGSLFVPDYGKPVSQEGWRKAGSQMDPNGYPQDSAFVSGGALDAGSQMDPNGNK